MTEPALAIVLDDFARILPDDAYLVRLEVEGAIVRFVALARDGGDLIERLERSGTLTGARFLGPAIRGEDGRARVEIETRVAGVQER